MLVIFLSKLLGFLFRMSFMKAAGEEAVGYYMATYPAFIFFISLTQLGLPIAVTKYVAQHYAKKEHTLVNALMRKAMLITFSSCIIFIPIIFFTIPLIAKHLLNNEKLATVLTIALIAVPFTLFASLFKAYLQGMMRIASTAFTQLLEQLIRIALVVILLPIYAQSNTNPLALAATVMGFTAIAEICSFLCLLIIVQKKAFASSQISYPARPIFRLALPSQGSRLFGTFTWFLEPILFFKALTAAGLSITAATALYGIISGVHVPLLLFPAFIPAALSIVLIPAVSESLARGKEKSTSHRIDLALKLSSLCGAIACTALYLFGDDLAAQLFHLSETKNYMKILAPVFYFYYIQGPLHAILQAVDEAKTAMMNSVYGGISKLVLLFTLSSQPAIQEQGAIIAIGFGVLITSLLHIVSLTRHSSISFRMLPFVYHYVLFIFVSIAITNIPLPFSTVQNIITVSLLMTLLFFITKQIRLNEITTLFKLLRKL